MFDARSYLRFVVLACLSSGFLWSQAGSGAPSLQQSTETPGTTRATAPTSQTPEDNLLLTAGQEILLRTRTSTSSAEAKVGDTIQFEVIKPVKIGDLVIIAKGAIATGTVTLVEAPKRKGRGGKLQISIEQVTLVTGQSCKVHAKELRKAGDRSNSDDILATIMTTPIPPLGIAFIPLVLWEKGQDLILTRGIRFTAEVEESVALRRDTVAKAQPAEAPLPSGKAEVYIYRTDTDSQAAGALAIFCGEQLVGHLGQRQYIHLMLPPGTYWLQDDASRWTKNRNSDSPKYFELKLETGTKYYVRYTVNITTKKPKNVIGQFEVAPQDVGAEQLTEMLSPTFATAPDLVVESYNRIGMSYGCMEFMNRYLSLLLQAQPGTMVERDKKAESYFISLAETGKCLETWEAEQSALPISDALRQGLVLPSGTSIWISTAKIFTAGARVGDQLEFEVLEDVTNRGFILVPKGTIASASIARVRSKEIIISFTRLRFASGFQVDLQPEPRPGKKEKPRVIVKGCKDRVNQSAACGIYNYRYLSQRDRVPFFLLRDVPMGISPSSGPLK